MTKQTRKTLFYIFITLLAAIWLVPIFFIFITALKSPADFYGRPIFSLPTQIRWDNFTEAWEKGRMSLYMKNGLIVCLMKVPLGILACSLTAFALTRLRLKFANGVFLFFLLGMMIPVQVTIVPINMAMTQLKLINTYLGLFIVYMAFGISFGVLVMRGFFRSIPKEIDESAYIDGCGNFRLYWSILMPIAKPAVATLFILDFLSTWNEYMLASILITDVKMRTVPTGLLSFVDEVGIQYGMLTAAVLLSILPILAVYILFQRYFVEGISGAVKG